MSVKIYEEEKNKNDNNNDIDNINDDNDNNAASNNSTGKLRSGHQLFFLNKAPRR